MNGGNPCLGCDREHAPKVFPTLAAQPLLAVLGMAPGAQEETTGAPFVGPSGIMLRAALRQAHIDSDRAVSYLNLGRCRPANDNFDTPVWADAEKRCSQYLARDLAGLRVPLLLLGKRPLQRMLGDNKAKLGSYRGLWLKTPDGRDAFVARHPAQILRTPDPAARAQLAQQFEADIQRMAARVRGVEVVAGRVATLITSLSQLAKFAARLAKARKWWAFDIESFDAKRFPSRKEVATDPCHPDFRVRGVAIAWSPTQGVWLELAPLLAQQDAVRALLTPAFMSEAEKGAFNGSFDEEGLIVPGWIGGLRKRWHDGMLAMVALGDGTHESLKLEKAVVDILGKPQIWNADKTQMRDLPIEVVARGSVGDACLTYELCETLEARLKAKVYL